MDSLLIDGRGKNTSRVMTGLWEQKVFIAPVEKGSLPKGRQIMHGGGENG